MAAETNCWISLSTYTPQSPFLKQKSAHPLQPSSHLHQASSFAYPRSRSKSYISKPTFCRIHTENTASAGTMILPTVNRMLAQNTTQLHGILTTGNHSFSTATPFPFPSQSQWSPVDISTVLFGCIASVLGVLTLWVTFWLGRRSFVRVVGNGMYSVWKCDDGTD